MTAPFGRNNAATVTGLISGTVNYGDASAFGGVYPVTVVVADAGGVSTSGTFNWTITPTVQTPVFSSTLGNQTDNAGDTVDVQAAANQPEGDQVIYDESGLPDGLSIDSLSGAVTGVIAGDASADNDVTLTATDQGVTTSESFDWTVNVQHDPTLTSPGDQTNAVGDAADVALTEDDAPGNTPTYVVTGLPDGLGYDPDSGEITGVLAGDAASATPYQVTATVSDGGATASTTFNWTVNAVGVTNPGDQYNTAGDRVSLPMTANGTYTYVITGLPQGLGYDPNSGLIGGTIAPTAGSDNPYAVTITTTDGVNSDSTSFNWYVAVPVLTDRSDVEGTAVGFQAPAPTDAGPTYSASNLPNGVGVNSSTGWISGTLATGDAANGPYAVTVTTTYADGTSSSQSFNWTVNPVVTTPPVLTNPGAQTSVAGTQVSVDLSAPESASNPLDYEAVGLPDGLYLDPDTGMVSGTVAEDAIQSSPDSVTETVTDSFGNSSSQTFNWSVPDTVLVVQGNALSATAGVDSGGFTVATFTDTDLSRQASDYAANINWGDGESSVGWIDGSNGSYTVTCDHTYLLPASLPVQVTVTDPVGESQTVVETASITAAPLSITGGFQEGAVRGGADGASSPLTVAAFADPNTYDGLSSYTATINWGDGTAATTGVIDGEDGQFRVTGNHAYALNGVYTVTVTITDVDGTMATTTSTVTVGDLYANMAQKATFAQFVNTSLTGDPSTYTAVIDWGDGTQDTTATGAVVVSGPPGGSFSVSGTHIYAATGAYQVKVTVTDGAGDKTSGTVTAQAVTAPATGYDGDVAVTLDAASDATEAVAADPAGQGGNGETVDDLETQTYTTLGLQAAQNFFRNAVGQLVSAAISLAFVSLAADQAPGSVGVSLPSTPDPREGAAAVPAPTLTRDDQTVAFDGSTNLIAVPKNSGTLQLTFNQPAAAIPFNDVNWAPAQRNTADVATSGAGDTPDNKLVTAGAVGADRDEATLNTNTQGSFSVIVYVDPKHGAFNAKTDKILAVVHVAIIGMTITANPVDTATGNPYPVTRQNTTAGGAKDGPDIFTGTPLVKGLPDANGNPTGTVGFTTRHGDPPPAGPPGTDKNGKPNTGISRKLLTDGLVGFDATVQLLGGGADGLLGVNKITLGWLQNIKFNVFTVLYGTVSMNEVPVSGTPAAPWLDTARPDAGTGGATAFTRTSTPIPVAGAKTGAIYDVLSMDAVYWKFPAYHNGVAWVSALGGWSFVNYLTAFSSDFPRNYTVLGSVNWTVAGRGKSGPGLSWTDNKSFVTIAGLKTQGRPESGQKAGLQPVGPTEIKKTQNYN